RRRAGKWEIRDRVRERQLRGDVREPAVSAVAGHVHETARRGRGAAGVRGGRVRGTAAARRCVPCVDGGAWASTELRSRGEERTQEADRERARGESGGASGGGASFGIAERPA